MSKGEIGNETPIEDMNLDESSSTDSDVPEDDELNVAFTRQNKNTKKCPQQYRAENDDKKLKDAFKKRNHSSAESYFSTLAQVFDKYVVQDQQDDDQYDDDKELVIDFSKFEESPIPKREIRHKYPETHQHQFINNNDQPKSSNSKCKQIFQPKSANTSTPEKEPKHAAAKFQSNKVILSSNDNTHITFDNHLIQSTLSYRCTWSTTMEKQNLSTSPPSLFPFLQSSSESNRKKPDSDLEFQKQCLNNLIENLRDACDDKHEHFCFLYNRLIQKVFQTLGFECKLFSFCSKITPIIHFDRQQNCHFEFLWSDDDQQNSDGDLLIDHEILLLSRIIFQFIVEYQQKIYQSQIK